MRILTTVVVLAGFVGCAVADPPPAVNFNLVQVNNYYPHQPGAPADTTVARRVVIDVGGATRATFPGTGAPTFHVAPVVVSVGHATADLTDGIPVPWETQTVVHSMMGTDSFRISSSRSGCPGTEVKPSVAVAFPARGGWSDPPIRFGPLAERALCPLGKGYQLEVSVNGNGSPVVKLHEPLHEASRR